MGMIRFRDIALSYFPQQPSTTATKHLKRWIYRCPLLYTELRQTGFQPRQRYLTPHMVERIYHHLGEP